MNHIIRLQPDLAAAGAELGAIVEALRALRAHLARDRLFGVERDGRRKDRIAVRDVDARLREITGLGGTPT